MSSSSIFILSILLALNLLAMTVAAATTSGGGSTTSTRRGLPACGYAFDGSAPLVDIDRQSDTTQLRANWYGFYGVQPFASTTSRRATGTSGMFPQPLPGPGAGTSGRTTGGSTGGGPGLLTYQVAIVSANVSDKSITSTGLKTPDARRCRSTPGFKKADVQNFKTVVTTQVQGPLGFPVSVWKSGKLNLVKGVKYYVVLKVTGNGRTIYTNTDGIVVGVNGTGSEDDDEFPPYKAGLIAMGIAICCLLVLLLLLILVAKGKGEDKYTTTVHRNENVDKL